MLKKISFASVALAALLSVAFASITPTPAEARGGRFAAGVALGIIGLGIIGALAEPPRHYYRSSGGCYRGPRECRWTARRCTENSWGDRTCTGGRRICRRPTYCD